LTPPTTRRRFQACNRRSRRLFHSRHVRRHGFLRQGGERRVERHCLLLLAAEAADGDSALGGLLLADDEQYGDLR
jgi:hypothetical protein